MLQYDKILIDPKKAHVDDRGYLVGDAWVTRTGIYDYYDQFGAPSKRFRSPEVVFDQQTIDSIKLLPMTVNHPPEMLNATNTKKYQVGYLGETVQTDEAGGKVLVNYVVTDKQAVDLIRNKEKFEISMGYEALISQKDGEYQGEKYDTIQTDIKYNHCAIVDAGRAGKDIRFIIDRKDSTMDPVKVQINGLQYDAAPEVAKEIGNLSKQIDSLNTKVSTLSGEKDAVQKQLDDSKEKYSEDKIQAQVDSKVSAIMTIKKDFPDLQFDSSSPVKMMEQAIKSVDKEINLDGKDEAYIKGFYSALQIKKSQKDAQDDADQVLDSDEQNDGTSPADKARMDMIKQTSEAYDAN